MIQISFLGKTDVITVAAEKIVTSNATNSIFLTFSTDELARDNETLLKKHGYKTQHTDLTIRVFNFNDFDLVIPN